MRVFGPGGGHVVVVGVDGSPESVEAARFAAAEAELRGLELLVVHACSTGWDRSPGAADVLPIAGRALVAEALSHVRVAPTTSVRRVVEAGSAATLLTAVSVDAAMVVLGQHRPDLTDGRPAGQVAPALGANARCPVVVVPAGWSRTTLPATRPVVVGIGGTGPAAVLLQVACEEAELRHTSVLVLHASAGAGGTTSQRAETARDLAETMAGQHHDHPDVALDYRVVPAPTLTAWVDASSRACLMVLGRPRSPRGQRSWQHSVARAMLHQARCPLVVVPARTRVAPPDDRPRRGTPVLVS